MMMIVDEHETFIAILFLWFLISVSLSIFVIVLVVRDMYRDWREERREKKDETMRT